MTSWIRFCLVVLVMTFCFQQSGWSGPLSLTEVLDSANQYYPLIVSSEAELRKAQADYLASQGGFDPVLKSSYANQFGDYYNNNVTSIALEQPTTLWGAKVVAGYRNGQGKFPVYNVQSGTFANGEWRAGLEVPILKGGNTDERRTKLRLSEVGVSVATEGLEAQKLEIRKQSATRYWDWVAAGRKIKVAKELLEIALNRNDAIKKRIKHGDLPAIDLTDNERSILQRQAGVVAAERAFQKAALELSIYYRNSAGDPSVEPLNRLPREFPVHEFEPTLRAALQAIDKRRGLVSKHPEIMKLGAQLLQLDSELNLAKNQVLPKLDLYAGVYSDLGNSPYDNASNNPNASASDLQYYRYFPPTNSPTEFKVSLSLELPLFFRTARGKVQASQAMIEKTELSQKLTLNKLEVQTQDSVQAMSAAFEKMKLAQEEIRLSQQLEDSERKRAFHGDSSFLLVNLREQGTRDAMGKEIESYAEFFKAKAEYEAACASNL
jgi:outer membrane protein TolC